MAVVVHVDSGSGHLVVQGLAIASVRRLGVGGERGGKVVGTQLDFATALAVDVGRTVGGSVSGW